MAAKLPGRAGTLNIVIEQGTTFNPILSVRYENGEAMDFTDYTARMHIRATRETATTLMELTTENGRLTFGDGVINVLISATDTAAITWTEGVYDLEIVSPGGVVTRLLKGSVSVSPEVTR